MQKLDYQDFRRSRFLIDWHCEVPRNLLEKIAVIKKQLILWMER